MNRYFTIGIMSLGIFPLFLAPPLDEKIGSSYFHLTRSALFALQQTRLDSIKTEKAYLAALRAADEKIFQNEFEAEFLLLLDKPQTLEYDSLSTLNGRKAYIENYWQAANPNPLLPENDWLLDVLKRRAYARENFPAPAPPYFDDRGKYYFKYGKPSFRYVDNGGYQQNCLNCLRYITISNESWSYENVAHNFLAHFIKDGAVFRETDNLSSFLEMGKFHNPELWSEIVKKRAAVAPYPFEKIHPSNPLLCYFEIYNLKTAGVTAQYEIVYKIISAKGGNRDLAVSVSSTRAVSDDTAQELIGIDLRKVPKGEHHLEITVTALHDRNLTASVQKEIRIDD